MGKCFPDREQHGKRPGVSGAEKSRDGLALGRKLRGRTDEAEWSAEPVLAAKSRAGWREPDWNWWTCCHCRDNDTE